MSGTDLNLGLLVFLTGLVLLCGCEQKSVRELKAKFSGDMYERSVEAPNFVIRARYLPPIMREIMAYGLPDTARPSRKMLDSLHAKRGNPPGMGLLLRIDPKTAGPTRDLIFGTENGYGNYRIALDQFSRGLEEKIWIEINGVRISMRGYQMENSFGMSSGRTFVLLFPSLEYGHQDKPDGFTLILDDIVPGLSRKKLNWMLPVGKKDESI
jgi:hypothetical protein